MHVISRKPFNEAILRFPNHMAALVDLLNILEKKMFHTPEEMKQYILHWIILNTEINGG